ncbi:multi-sensor signal transduction histidine kinase [Candidatus Scalindua japonica]|uniref:histidine kinase n=1 Tax=Candidatus Scalindua japonica TaxID=1284222 RepID=A0A286TZ63_9BACT|nr:hybrid sensor histidine kinase/response regulator [Candidatus Scalindua japonica]GAX61101.1 multi-sensor signal transduction histidine kinase [Candidatus Scalindua japonica]
MKVLIVDDNPKIMAIAKVHLKKESLEVLCVEDGKRALESAHREKPDLILLDVDMPEMSGFEVCQALKDDTVLCMIPVIFLSAADDNGSRIRGLDLGAVDYVTKPFDSFELRARVRAAMRTKQLQDQLATLNQDLEKRVEQRTDKINQLLRQKDAFVNQLSHDLKTPLTPLLALLPMVANRTEDIESKRMLDLVMDNVKYMKNLTEMTLQLAQLNSSRISLKLEKVDLISEIGNVIKSLSSLFEENSIKVVNNTSSPLYVEADRMLIMEVFHNLISNTVKYTNGKGFVYFDAIIDSSETITVSVRDNGIGMTEMQLKRVFEEFYKVDDSRNDRSSTGLGLSICQRIIEKHGGRIWVESQGIGQGTTIYFTLPVRQGELETPASVGSLKQR